jgi:hypothetical protein
VSRTQLLFLHVANLVVSGTGLVYAWMRYLVAPADEWAVVNHPWQPLFQHLHVLAAPLLVFAMGLIWSAHIIGKLQNGRKNRMAGLGLTALFLPMASSGYLLQVSVQPGWRQAWIWVHIVSSLLWVAAFVVHQVVAMAKKNETEGHDGGQRPVVTPFRISAPTGDESDDDSQRPRSNPSRAN